MPYPGDILKPPDPDEPVIPGLDLKYRMHNDWQEDPWASPEVKARRKRERHARWIASLSERDWTRLRERAELVLQGQKFARFSDLDAGFDVFVADPGDTHPPNGERFGTLAGAILLAFQRVTTR